MVKCYTTLICPKYEYFCKLLFYNCHNFLSLSDNFGIYIYIDGSVSQSGGDFKCYLGFG